MCIHVQLCRHYLSYSYAIIYYMIRRIFNQALLSLLILISHCIYSAPDREEENVSEEGA